MKKTLRRLLLLAVPVALLGLLALADLPWVSAFARVALIALAAIFAIILLWRGLQKFLWKVGRRLAFSYFLLGVLPIPLLLLVLGLLAYLLSGFFLGHLYRDAVRSLQLDLDSRARARLEEVQTARTPRRASALETPDVAFGVYRGGKRIAGDRRTPAVWPSWPQAGPPEGERKAMPPLIAGPGGRPTLAAVASRKGSGVVALYVGDFDQEISRRGEIWVETYRSDDPDLSTVSLQIARRKIPVQRVRRDPQAVEATRFFKRLSQGERFWDDPVLWWGEISGPLVDLAAGRKAADYLAANLNGTPRTVLRHLFSSAPEIDAFAWLTLFVVAFLLFDVYATAALMAVFMIVGLSRAVNRLSRATAAVRQGNFGVRIPVRRRDQVGDLQRSFNEMAGNLESLVASSAQKELLEKELALARNLQESLLPRDLPAGDGVELATLFEPSAAIGGDYFDVLRLSEHELAVIIADVSGHGLSSGLRMAMLKAALLILIEETREPEEILRRLDAVVRSNAGSRFFVTATLGLFDLRTGVLRLINAGHPPTYRVRGGEVEEIVLPSSPLGGLGRHYAQTTLTLQPGDAVVWLSDGLIEATNANDDPFGYENVLRALARPAGAGGHSAAEIRDRLLAAVAAHTAGQALSDDRTLMVMRALTPPTPSLPASPPSAGREGDSRNSIQDAFLPPLPADGGEAGRGGSGR